VFENGSVRAYWGNVESIFHVFPIDDLIAISCDYDNALHLSVGMIGAEKGSTPYFWNAASCSASQAFRSVATISLTSSTVAGRQSFIARV
jgi:hypothetical protein